MTTKDATARPWKYGTLDGDGHHSFTIHDGVRYVADACDEQTVALIVHAVNAHEAMVDVVHDCIDLLNRPNLTIRERSTINKARAALALAEGKD